MYESKLGLRGLGGEEAQGGDYHADVIGCYEVLEGLLVGIVCREDFDTKFGNSGGLELLVKMIKGL